MITESANWRRNKIRLTDFPVEYENLVRKGGVLFFGDIPYCICMSFDTRQIDLQYNPFPDLQNWYGINIDENRAKRYNSNLENLKSLPKEVFLKAQNIVKRIAAIETGSVEGLYETDRGFTFTVALQSASWESLFSSKGEKTTNLINDQISAYEFVLDFATEKTPISPAWIRQLHEVICSSQTEYQVLTEQGWQTQSLTKGQYKSLPNHVVDRNDEIHAYCPVDMVPSEMQRFCDIINDQEFGTLHPLLQAAFVHYVLVYIHPFADGNGRVARALASVFTYREYSVPLLIFADEREEYYMALSEADSGYFNRFANFISEKTFDAILIVKDALESAKKSDSNDIVKEIEELYITKSGYSQDEIDVFAKKLIVEISKKFKEKLGRIANNSSVQTEIQITSSHFPNQDIENNFRNLININESGIFVKVSSKPPFEVSDSKQFIVKVPKDCGEFDDIVLYDYTISKNTLEVRPKEIANGINSQTMIRIKMFVERESSELLERVRKFAVEKKSQ